MALCLRGERKRLFRALRSRAVSVALHFTPRYTLHGPTSSRYWRPSLLISGADASSRRAAQVANSGTASPLQVKGEVLPIEIFGCRFRARNSSIFTERRAQIRPTIARAICRGFVSCAKRSKGANAFVPPDCMTFSPGIQSSFLAADQVPYNMDAAPYLLSFQSFCLHFAMSKNSGMRAEAHSEPQNAREKGNCVASGYASCQPRSSVYRPIASRGSMFSPSACRR